MKKAYGIVSLTVALSIFLFACETQPEKEERLAKQYCGSCHSFPDPKLLDKETWEKGVLPQMAFRMGMDYSLISSISKADQLEALKVIPENPMLSNEEAPDSLTVPTQIITKAIQQFEVTPFRLPVLAAPLITLVSTDTLNSKIYLGNRYSKLYQLNTKFMLEDSIQLSSPPSNMLFRKNENPLLLLMGIMDPNDQAKGELAQLKLSDHTFSKLIDSVKRPVHFEEVDLNRDNLKDYVICGFGNYTGALLAYENLGNGKFKKYYLQTLPGARKVIVKDFDKNGLMDIMALMSQGDEKIILLLNQGNFNFRITTLLRFPPVYGSSYFDIADFNNDGKFDILYTNGDNADYSIILKPYHGVRIFLNDGNNQFNESWFYPMHGASQAIAHDFDRDGDLDVAAISFFPDFEKHPEQGFIYFENSGKEFIPQITTLASSGRWLTMNAADYDNDGDKDILLGSLNFASGVPLEIQQRWIKEKTSLLVLRNKLK
jgi:hypothetical protein